MSDTSVRGYKHIGFSRGGDFLSANGLNHVSPPVDKHKRIFMAMIAAGVGFLLPYNSFIFAVDFFQERFPNTTIMFDMSMVYIITAFFAVLLNNILVEVLSLNTRITFGYVISLVTLAFIGCFEIDMQTFSPKIAYNINLIAVGVVAFGCTIQQSSYYGYTSMLPTRYTQAVMAGESGAGVWVSINRILTKLLVVDEKRNTEVFFGLTSVTLFFCWILYVIVRKTAFIEFYITLCQESRKKIILEPTEDAGLIDLEAHDVPRGQTAKVHLQDKTSSSAGVSLSFEENLRMQSESAQFSSLSFANPVYEPTSKGLTGINQSNLQIPGPTFKVEDVIVRSQNTGRTRGKTWSSIKAGLKARWLIAQQIYPYMVFIALAYFVTLCLYPGILSEIVSCRFGSWMPVILMTTFNLGDLLGKMFAPSVSEWARSKLAAWCSLRVLLLPLVLMCCAPRGSPHAAAAGDMGPAVLAFILGASGGALGAAPMLAAGQRVRNDARELAGNIMTLSYNLGLTAGSLVAYLFKAMLGPQVDNACSSVYPTIGSITRAITSTTTANATTSTLVITTSAAVISTVLSNITNFTAGNVSIVTESSMEIVFSTIGVHNATPGLNSSMVNNLYSLTNFELTTPSPAYE